MRFDVAGPFELRRYGSKKILTDESLADLKVQLEEWETGLAEACGCYLFAMRAGKGLMPYYVGQACKRSLSKEALNSANIVKFNKILSNRNGTPVIFLLPMRTPSGKFRKQKKTNGGLNELDFLERWLIAAALEKNSTLINNKETYFLRNIHVSGIFNPRQGEATLASQELAKALR